MIRLVAFFLCWAAVLAGMLLLPSPGEIAADGRDKWLHVAAFVTMSVTAWGLSTRLWWRASLWPVLIALAGLLEWLQPHLQPTREFSWLDIRANLAGVIVAWIALWLAQKVKAANVGVVG